MNGFTRVVYVGLLSVMLASVLTTVGASNAPPGQEATPAHGEFAATIRSAGLPCAHVISVEAFGQNAWQVTCNSGNARVVRGEDGQLSVANP